MTREKWKIPEQRGALLVLTALLLPVFFACAGVAVDLGSMYAHKSNLQNAVDAAALAGAAGYIAGEETAEYHPGANTMSDEYLKADLGKGYQNVIDKDFQAQTVSGKTYYRVKVTQKSPVYFMTLLGLDSLMDVSADAVALVGSETSGTPDFEFKDLISVKTIGDLASLASGGSTGGNNGRLHEIFAEKAKRSGISGRSRLDLMMVRAGLPLLGSEFLAISAGLSLLVFVIFALATLNPVTGLLAVLLFLAADFVFVQRRISKRLNNFQRQLADCLSLVANSLRAGFSFLQTMEIISREMEPPMSTEFEKVMRDTSLGKSLDEALHDMDERVGSADFSLVVTAVLIQQQVGGNLATILDTIRETISERIRIRREVNTLTAQGKMSGIVLACIPVALALFFYVSSPEYLEPLLTTDIGKMAIIGALFLVIVGFVIIRKIVDIKV